MTSSSSKRVRILLWCLIAANMVFIFAMSAQSGLESDSSSGSVIIWLLRLFRTDYDAMSPEAQSALVLSWQSVVRTLAHFSEYTLLGFLAGLQAKQYAIRHAYWVSWGGSVLYALTDEFHQLFVPGRYCDLADICVDASGVLLGTGIAALLLLLVMRHKRRQNGQT